MPSFASTSEVRDGADGVLLVLRARHVFVVGTPSSDTHTVKGRLPDDLDVTLESDLVVTLTGMVNRVKIDAHRVQSSAIAKHLLHYFHVNGEQLGVRPASKLFVDESDGVTKLTLSPTRPILPSRSADAVRLSAIELLYVFKTRPLAGPQQQSLHTAHTHADPNTTAEPFSPHAFLPLVAALDRTVDRFAALFVRRYPLIFGPWRERYAAEVAASLKLARAMADIIARSPHAQFRKQSRRLLKTMNSNTAAASSTSVGALCRLLQSGQMKVDDVPLPNGESELPSTRNDFEILCRSMERLFKSGRGPMRYKSVSSSAISGCSTKDVDDDFALSESRSESPPVMFRVGDGCHGRSASWSGLDLDLDLDLGLDLDVDAPRGRDELCFDEDTETMGGSQELELGDDMFFSDDDGFIDETDPWSADEMDCTPDGAVDDFDDLWTSSQSTLDDEAFEWEEHALGSSQSSGAAVSSSDSRPGLRAGSPDVFLAHDDDDDWLDHSADAERRLDDLCNQAPAVPEQALELMLVDTSGPPFDSLGLELSFADVDALDFKPNAGLLELTAGAQTTSTAHLPLRAGDDLAYGTRGSMAFLAPFTLTTPRTAGSFDAPARRSSDDSEISSELTTTFSSASPPPDPGRASRRTLHTVSQGASCSPVAASPPAAWWAIDGGAHGRNEDGLVAGHALGTIRPGQGGLVKGLFGCLGVGGLGTPGSDREWDEEGEESLESDAMLWAE